MAILNILSFCALLVFSKATYIDIGVCPPMPAVVSPFDVERVSMTLLSGTLLKLTYSSSSTQVIGTLSGLRRSPIYLMGMNVPVLSMDHSSRGSTTLVFTTAAFDQMPGWKFNRLILFWPPFGLLFGPFLAY